MKPLKHIDSLSPYAPPTNKRTQFDGLRLDFNERGSDPLFVKNILKEIGAKDTVHIYPEYGEIEAAIAKYCSVASEQILVCDGSDQGIETIFRTYSEKNDKVIIPEPTFSMFSQVASVAGNEIYSPGYDKNMNYPTEKVLSAIDQQTKIVVIVTPNNPTGTSVSRNNIEKIAKTAENALVIVDEAYFEFSNQTVIDLLNQHENVVILRTFSKAFGLAGLRIGYMVSSSRNIAVMKKVQSPYGVSTVAVNCALGALKNIDEMKGYVDEVKRQAKPFVEDFFAQNNIKFYKSDANFVLFEVSNQQDVFQKLKNKGILLRPQNKNGISSCIRITVTTMSEMKQFTKAYKELFL
jgi:histidinol-phosphate aminotransferase